MTHHNEITTQPYVRLRLTQLTFNAMQEHLTCNPTIEQFCYGLCAVHRTPDGIVLITQELLLPSPEDLAIQHAGLVQPAKHFQSFAYGRAQQHGFCITDIHTHTHTGQPRFSGIDDREMRENANYIRDRLDAPCTSASIVFDNTVSHFEGRHFDRARNAFITINEIEILGRGYRCILSKGSYESAETDPMYDRQVRIEGFDQSQLARQKVLILGAGGTGAHQLQTLASLGVGTDGWLAVVDRDKTEDSNLPRLPYATPQDVGQSKVAIATEFIRRKNPAVHILPYPCDLLSDAVRERAIGATLLIEASDNDGVRKVLNEWSVQFKIPLISQGCDVISENDDLRAIGQIRVVLPDENACLLCCGGYDASQAAFDLMNDEDAGLYAQHGYAHGIDADVTPSIATLNALTAQYGVAAFLSVVLGQQFGSWDYLHFDQLQGNTIAAQTKPLNTCPLCGVLPGDATAWGFDENENPETLRLLPAPVEVTNEED